MSYNEVLQEVAKSHEALEAIEPIADYLGEDDPEVMRLVRTMAGPHIANSYSHLVHLSGVEVKDQVEEIKGVFNDSSSL